MKTELNNQVAAFLGQPVSRKDMDSSYYKLYYDSKWIGIRVSNHWYNPSNSGCVDQWIRLYECDTIDTLKSELNRIFGVSKIVMELWNEDKGDYNHVMNLN
ncbi:MAG: hypothetical protein V3W20_02875 [Candidatus Neomarinimicrobiota bacterium]